MERKLQKHRELFHSRMQLPEETFSEYLADLENLIEKCHFQEDVKYLELNKQITEGVYNKKLKNKLENKRTDYYCNGNTEKYMETEKLNNRNMSFTRSSI